MARGRKLAGIGGFFQVYPVTARRRPGYFNFGRMPNYAAVREHARRVSQKVVMAKRKETKNEGQE